MKDFSWVEPTYLAYGSTYVLGKEISFDPLEIRVSSDWKILLVLAKKRIFHKIEWCSNPFYACIFQDLGFRLPLTSFEKEVLDHVSISPSQFYLCGWGFILVF